MQAEPLVHVCAAAELKAAPPVVGESAADDTGLSGCRVLIVENEALQALMMSQMVTELGAIVVGIATSVQGAIAEIATTPFDIVILDLNLGNGMFSLGISDGLRDLGAAFLFCTAYGQLVQELAEAPVVQKPYTKEELAEGLHKALTSRLRRQQPSS